jgi:pimeloyl-ACP methyl ester carboxylesterase
MSVSDLHLALTCHETYVDGHKLVYATAGAPSAPPLMLIHGWTCHKFVWRHVLAALAERFYLIAPDLLGHGESAAPPDGDYSISAQARRVLALADQLGLARFALMGHSMGGLISLYIGAVLAPERLTQLIDVAGIISGRATPRLIWLNGALVLLPLIFPPYLAVQRQSMERHPRLGKFGFRVWFADMDALPYDAWAQDRHYATRPDARMARWRAGLATLSTDISAHLDRISAPTLIVFGARDGAVCVREGALAAARIPKSRFLLFDGCGHFPMLEQPERFIAAIRDFLSA